MAEAAAEDVVSVVVVGAPSEAAVVTADAVLQAAVEASMGAVAATDTVTAASATASVGDSA
jgi:hypothetical protein